jgi:hypothetical protein
MDNYKHTQIEEDDHTHIEVIYKIINRFEKNDFDSQSPIQEIKGDVFLDDEDETKKIGEISLYLINMKVGREYDDFDYYDILDSHSLELTQYVNHFFDIDTQLINPQFSNYDDFFFNPDILIIHTVVLNESARNRGYGLRVMKNIEFVFGQDKLIIVNPYPIQYGGFMNNPTEVKEFNLDLLPKNKNKCKSFVKKIANTYLKLGYKKDKKSHLMFKTNQEQF